MHLGLCQRSEFLADVSQWRDFGLWTYVLKVTQSFWKIAKGEYGHNHRVKLDKFNVFIIIMGTLTLSIFAEDL